MRISCIVPYHTLFPFLPGPPSYPCTLPSPETHQVKLVLLIHLLKHIQCLSGQPFKDNWVLPHPTLLSGTIYCEELHFSIFIIIFKDFLSISFFFFPGGMSPRKTSMYVCHSHLWVCSHQPHCKRSFPAYSSQQTSQSDIWLLLPSKC